MKVAIASLGKDLESEVSSVAGRSPYYVIFENGKLIEVFKNPFLVGGGAGFGIARILKDKGVSKVIAGNFGGNMKNSLKEYNIEYIESKGKVKDFIN